MRSYFTIAITGLLVITALLPSCRNRDHSETSLQAADSLANNDPDAITITADQFSLAGMKLGTIQEYMDADLVSASGYIDVPPENKVHIGTFMGGYIKSLNLLPGDRVIKDQELTVLENIEYLKLQQDYLDTKAQLDYMKSVYESQKTLAEEKISAQRNFLEAQSNYNRLLVTFESLARQLQLIQINPADVKAETMVSSISLRSPIDGYITEVRVVNGMFVNPADVICEIVNTDHLHLQLKIYEKDIFAVCKGQAIDFRIPEAAGEICRGEVIMVSKTVEENERTITVHGHIKECRNLNLAPGMYVEARIHTHTRKVNGFPLEALVTEEGKHYIFLQKAWTSDTYTFEKLPVRIGKITEDWFEVQDTSTYEKDDSTFILVKGAYYLEEEM